MNAIATESDKDKVENMSSLVFKCITFLARTSSSKSRSQNVGTQIYLMNETDDIDTSHAKLFVQHIGLLIRI